MALQTFIQATGRQSFTVLTDQKKLIEKLRKEQGYSYDRLATMSIASKPTLINITKGRSRGNPSILKRLQELYYGEQEVTNQSTALIVSESLQPVAHQVDHRPCYFPYEGKLYPGRSLEDVPESIRQKRYVRIVEAVNENDEFDEIEFDEFDEPARTPPTYSELRKALHWARIEKNFPLERLAAIANVPVADLKNICDFGRYAHPTILHRLAPLVDEWRIDQARKHQEEMAAKGIRWNPYSDPGQYSGYSIKEMQQGRKELSPPSLPVERQEKAMPPLIRAMAAALNQLRLPAEHLDLMEGD